jgi:hypothetical protein
LKRSFHRTALVIALMLIALGPSSSFAQRTDVVILENGDRITGDVKELQRGILRLRTDHISNIYIEWIHIDSVHATKVYGVELDTGERYYGELRPGSEVGKLTVMVGDNPVELDHHRVVRIIRIKRGFFNRLEGDIDIGVNYTKAQDDLNINAAVKTKYRTRRHLTTVDLDYTLRDRSEADQTRRAVLRGGHFRFLRKRWTAWGLASIETNDELNLDLRATVGGGGGRVMIQSNRTTLSLLGGATVNQEGYLGADSSRTTAEGLFGIRYDRFILGDLGHEITVNFMLLPSLTQSDRLRTEFDAGYKHEVILDLFIRFSAWHSFDSENPTTGESVDDYGFVTSLGWTFN